MFIIQRFLSDKFVFRRICISLFENFHNLSDTRDMNNEKGTRYALLSYTAWGLFPLYWKLLAHIPALEILFNRVLWSWVFYSILLIFYKSKFSKDSASYLQAPAVTAPQMKLILAASALLSVNWFIYIWAVNAGHVVETSLGYFINPLVNVALGVFVQKEILSKDKKISIAIAALGVAILTFEAGRLPWIALSLAVSFGLYGLLKKRANISGVRSGQIESVAMILPVLAILLLSSETLVSFSADLNRPTMTWVYLILSGVITGLPLIWFTEAARRLPLNVLGMFQYIAPTMQFLIGVVIFREPVTSLKWVGFFFIWLALVKMTYSSFKNRQRTTS